MWEGRGFTGFWWGNLKEADHWGDLSVDGKGRIILKMFFKSGMWVYGLD
jgi:hypothetical protein